MTSPRGLSASEAEAWSRLAATVEPIRGKIAATPPPPSTAAAGLADPSVSRARSADGLSGRPPRGASVSLPAQDDRRDEAGLDSHWERRLRAGGLAPDFTLDLHEHTLDAAYQRLLGGLDIARETGARVVLVIAGRERSAPAADRGTQRGAIRAKLLDWLAASRHADAIAAIRKAQRRHGGDGALYIILKKPRRLPS